MEVLRLAAQKKNVAVHLDFPDAGICLEADGSLLHQVVRKLVDNAVKYSPAGARVLVRGRAEGDDVALEVEDFGVGHPARAPAAHLREVLHGGRRHQPARRAARASGSTWCARSCACTTARWPCDSHPGQGSVFSVRLPRRFPGPSGPAAPA